jgi:ferritin-like metal-binding protein YciE
MMINLNTLRDRLDNMLSKETADSLNEWINNKRNMTDEQIARVELMGVLDNVQSIMHELTLDEMDELIDELTHLYERFSDITDMRNGEKPE